MHDVKDGAVVVHPDMEGIYNIEIKNGIYEGVVTRLISKVQIGHAISLARDQWEMRVKMRI